MVEGSKIHMADGTLKNVEDLQVGDLLLSYDIPSLPLLETTYEVKAWSAEDLEGSTLSTTTVVGIQPSSFARYYLINNTLKVTYEHPILRFNNGLWRFDQADTLEIGDLIINEQGMTDTVQSMEVIEGYVPVYTIDTEELDVYFVDGFLAHNNVFK